MTSVRWDDGDYIGRKTRSNYKRLDKLLNKEFDKCKDGITDDTTLERILKITARQNNTAHTITKIVDSLTLNKRMHELDRLVHLVPAEVLAKWVKSVPDHEKESWR